MANIRNAPPIIQRAPIIIGSVGAPSSVVQGSLASVQPTSVPNTPLEITKFQFRKLFTFNERLAIDNIEYNTTLSGSVKAAVQTMQKDVDASAMVNLHLPDVIAGVSFITSIGILTPARATRILNNLPPLPV